MERLEELQKIFEDIDSDKRIVITPLIHHAVEWENELADYQSQLDGMALTKQTKEKYVLLCRLKREAQQQYCNIIKTLLMTLYRVESSAADDLLERLKEFE